MRTFRIPYLIALTTIILSTGCSSDNEDEITGVEKTIDNTTWIYSSEHWHESSTIAVDENKTYPAVVERALTLQELGYTDNTKEEKQSMDWNLCERSNHDCDTTITASFNSGKCLLSVHVSKTHLKAEKVTTEKSYKFEEGNYIVTIGSKRYGVEVYNYAIYMNTADGNKLYLPLDGAGCAVYERSKTYNNKVWYNEIVKEYTLTADYTISGNDITFSYNENGQNKVFSASITYNGQNFILCKNSITNSILRFKKQ